MRSEEHTSELQSRFDLVCRLLLEIPTDLMSTHFPYTTLFRSSDEEEDKTSENEEEESEEVEGDYSFTIHSEKVEGEMDVLGALGGEIDIEQGTIQGLTITQN